MNRKQASIVNRWRMRLIAIHARTFVLIDHARITGYSKYCFKSRVKRKYFPDYQRTDYNERN